MKLDIPDRQEGILRFLLQNGPSAGAKIVMGGAATRAQVYTHLDRMTARGLVARSASGDPPRWKFWATPLARRLLHVIDLAQEVLEEMEKSDE